MKRFKTILRMTSVRMSLIYMACFALISVILVYYVTFSTAKVLRGEITASINEEIASLSNVYRGGNISRLARAIDRRSKAPGANLYLLANRTGRIIAGNVAGLAPRVLAREGWHNKAPFLYTRFGDEEGQEKGRHIAIGRVFKLSGDIRLMVGRDVGQLGKFRNTIRKALVFALGSMTLMGILVWFFIGRRTLKRLDGVSNASQKILSGNLSERLPLAGSGDEFDRLSLNLNQMLERVETLNEGLKQVSDNIAHDLKTPITRLRNKAETVLATGSTIEEYRETVENVVDEADRLIKTFNALLMISRVEAGSQAAQFSPIDLATILSDVYELYEPIGEEAGITLTIDTPQSWVYQGNRELLAQAISNLLDNALKYGTPEDQTDNQIELKLTPDENAIIISVCDKGMGIADDDHEAVKKRFVRLEKSRTKTGSGLGLSLVNAVAILHKGSLNFKDNKPGLIAQIRLPM